MSLLLKECGFDPNTDSASVSDVDFLNADTEDDLALIVMAAVKK
jgi:hypothetical protein